MEESEKLRDVQIDASQTCQVDQYNISLIQQNPHNPLLTSSTPSGLPLGGSHNLAHEILMGTDESLEASEFMAGDMMMGEVLDVSSVMERSRGI